MYMHTKETYSKSRKKKAVVYWIHYLHHDDPKTQGYIGISTNPITRFKTHSKNNNHVGNRIKFGAIMSILHETNSLDEAAIIEREYRPEEDIGWNINKGGDIPPSKKGISAETNKLKGDARTDKQKLAALNHSKRMKGRKPWNLNKKTNVIPWNKGLKIDNHNLSNLAKIERTCPACKKQGKGSSMLRWHFDNCRFKVGA